MRATQLWCPGCEASGLFSPRRGLAACSCPPPGRAAAAATAPPSRRAAAPRRAGRRGATAWRAAARRSRRRRRRSWWGRPPRAAGPGHRLRRTPRWWWRRSAAAVAAGPGTPWRPAGRGRRAAAALAAAGRATPASAARCCRRPGGAPRRSRACTPGSGRGRGSPRRASSRSSPWRRCAASTLAGGRLESCAGGRRLQTRTGATTPVSSQLHSRELALLASASLCSGLLPAEQTPADESGTSPAIISGASSRRAARAARFARPGPRARQTLPHGTAMRRYARRGTHPSHAAGARKLRALLLVVPRKRAELQGSSGLEGASPRRTELSSRDSTNVISSVVQTFAARPAGVLRFVLMIRS